MEWTKYNRNAFKGERVFYYPNGRRDLEPVVAFVSTSSGVVANLSLMRPGHSRFETHNLSSVRHIDDPHWEVFPALKHSEGAWDFHPVEGALWDKELNRQKSRETARANLEDQKRDLSAEEFEALEALGRFGPKIALISGDTGIHHERLRKLPKFMAEFSRRKDEEAVQKTAAKKAATQKKTSKPQTVSA